MSEPTIIAVLILAGVFILMAVTILKSGVEAAIKMWGVMGALTGVAFGAITSYYFTDKAYQQKFVQLKSENQEVRLVLANAKAQAAEAGKVLAQFTNTLGGEKDVSKGVPSWANYTKSLPEKERIDLINKFTAATKNLENIEAVNIKGARLAE